MNAAHAIPAPQTAANDTAEPTTLALGTTVQSATWRAHRYDTHIEIVDLRNAGKRSTTCAGFIISSLGYGADAANLASVATSILFAVNSDVAVETMARMLADVGQLGLDLRRTEERGCDVDREPVLRCESADVSARFSMREFRVTFSSTMTRPRDGSTFRHDTSVGHASRKDAAKAYAWAQEHIAEVVRMDRNTFIRAMDAIGVRCN